MRYTYNPIGQSLGIIGNGEPVYMPLRKYVHDSCEAYGVGVGKNGIITSTGPFQVTMEELTQLAVDEATAHVHLRLLHSLDGGVETLEYYTKKEALRIKKQLMEIEVQQKVAMYQNLAQAIRHRFINHKEEL